MDDKRIILETSSAKELRCEFMKYVDENDVDKLIKYLSNNNNLFNEKDEFFIKEKEYVNQEPGKLSYNIPKTNYFVNLKLATILILCSILDYKLSNGFTTVLFTAFGKIEPFISKIDEVSGSKCIIREALKQDGRKLKLDSIPGNARSECINNDLLCKYRCECMCSIKKEDIVNIAKELVSKKIFENHNDEFTVAL